MRTCTCIKKGHYIQIYRQEPHSKVVEIFSDPRILLKAIYSSEHDLDLHKIVLSYVPTQQQLNCPR